ncbi:MAG: DUF4157 domain-containing protein [Candidatus Kapaibacterium sp.]
MNTYKLILILLFAISSFGFAQKLQVQIIMSPKPSPYLTDWQDKSETIQLAITNLSDEEVSFRIGAKVYAGSNFDDNLQAATKVLEMPAHTITGFESILFDGIDIVPYNAIEFFNNVEQSVVRTGKLPSRDYTICITLYDVKTNAELTAPVCHTFFLDSYQQPNLIYPLDGSDIPITTLQGQVFRWTPVTPTPSGVVNYILFGMRVDSWQQPMQAFKVNQPFFEIELPLQTQTIWPPDFDLPKIGETIVWSVKATDDQGRPIGEQDGVASPYIFNVIDAGFNKPDLCNCKPATEGATIRAASSMGASATSEGNNIVLKKGDPERAIVAHEAAHTVQQKSEIQKSTSQYGATESFDELLKKMRVGNPDVEIVYNWKFYGINENGESFTDQSEGSEFIIDYPELTEGRLSVTGMIICSGITCQFSDEIKISVDKSSNEGEIVFDDVPVGTLAVSPVDNDGDGEIDYIDFKSVQRQTPKTDFGTVMGGGSNLQLILKDNKDQGFNLIDCFPTRYVYPAFSTEIPVWDGAFTFRYMDDKGREYKGYTKSEHLLFAPYGSGKIEIQFVGTMFIDGVHPLLNDTMGINITVASNSTKLLDINNDSESIYNILGQISDYSTNNIGFPDDLSFPVASIDEFETFKLEQNDLDLLDYLEAFKAPIPLPIVTPNNNPSEKLDLGDWSAKFEPADGSPPIFLFLENSSDFYYLPPCSGILDVNFKRKNKKTDDKKSTKKEEPVDLNYKKIVFINPTVDKNKGSVDTDNKKTTDVTVIKEADSESSTLFITPLEKIEPHKLKMKDLTNELDFTDIDIALPTPKVKQRKYYQTFQKSNTNSDNPLYKGMYNENNTSLHQTNYYIIPSDVVITDESGKTNVINTNPNVGDEISLKDRNSHDHIGNYNFSISIIKEVLNFNGSADGIDESFEPTVINAYYSVPTSAMNKAELINEIQKATYAKYGQIERNLKNNGQNCSNQSLTNINQNIKQHKSAPLIRIYVEGIKTTEVKETQIRYIPVGVDELSDDPNEMADLIYTWFSDNHIESNKLIKAKVYENTFNHHETKAAICTVLATNFGNNNSTYFEAPNSDYWGMDITENDFQLKQPNYRDILAANILTHPIKAKVESNNGKLGSIRWVSPETININIYSEDDIDFLAFKNIPFSKNKDLYKTTPMLYIMFSDNPESYNYVIKNLSTITPLISRTSLSGGSFDLSTTNLEKGKLYIATVSETENPNNSTILPFWLPEVDDEVLTSTLTGGSDIRNIEQGFKITSPTANEDYNLLDVEYKFTRLDNDRNTYYTIYYENSYANNTSKKKDCDSISATAENPFGPNRSEEWKALSDSLRQAESDLEYWKKRCPQEKDIEDARIKNQEILNKNIDRLKQWAKELGIELPENAGYNFKECCPPNGDCCEGIDPNTPEGRSAYLEKMRCISRKLNQLNGTMNADMGNFIDQMDFWNRREDSRNTWIMYDWYFSNVEWILSGGPISDAIDYVKEETGYNDVVKWLGEKMLNNFCSYNNLSPQQCEDLKKLLLDIQAAKEKYDDVKEAADAVKDIVNAARTGGSFPPGLIIKMTAMMAGAVAAETGNMVAFYNAKYMEMGGTAKSVMMTMLCLKQYYAMIAEMKEKCGKFCEESISNLEADVERLQKEKETVRSAFYDNEEIASNAAGKSIDEAIKRILEHFNDPIGSNRQKCCPNGSETVVYNYPEDEDKNECSKMIASQLKLSLGERYCWMKIKVIVICTPEGTEINYEYEILKERNNDCCPDDIDEIPLGGRSGGDMGEADEGEIKPPIGGASLGGGRIRVGGNDGGPAGSDHRTTPWQPGPGGDPPYRGDNKKCKCLIKLSYNGKGLKPDGKIIVSYDDLATITAAGNCEGDCFKDGNWLVVDPPPMNNFPFINIPLTRIKGTTYSTTKDFRFVIPGTWTFRFYQRCSDGSVCSVGLTVIVKKPKDPDRGKPDIDNEKVEIEKVDCGRDTCLQVDYNHYIKRQPTITKRMVGEVILRSGVGLTRLGIDTQCKEVCLNDPNKVVWLIYRPDGRLDTKKGVNLYTLDYNFDIVGKYKICIIEEKGCTKGVNRNYSRTFFVDVK